MKTKFWAGRTGDTLPTNPEDLSRPTEKELLLMPLAGELWTKCAISISEKTVFEHPNGCGAKIDWKEIKQKCQQKTK